MDTKENERLALAAVLALEAVRDDAQVRLTEASALVREARAAYQVACTAADLEVPEADRVTVVRHNYYGKPAPPIQAVVVRRTQASVWACPVGSRNKHDVVRFTRGREVGGSKTLETGWRP